MKQLELDALDALTLSYKGHGLAGGWFGDEASTPIGALRGVALSCVGRMRTSRIDYCHTGVQQVTISKPSLVTVDEAVALLINLDYIPAGFILLDMTAAYQEEAAVAYENACIDMLSDDQITTLRLRRDACQSRHSLAQLLVEALKRELDMSDESLVVVSDESGIQARLTLESVSEWAFDKYGIGIPEWSHAGRGAGDAGEADQNARWEDVTIKIYENYRIGYVVGKGQYKPSSFQNIGLMGVRKNLPNDLGGILMGLSHAKKFPPGTHAQAKHKTAISKLRRALKRLTDLSSDPFLTFNNGDGWKPRFQLVDDRRNADERAKTKATHVPFDDSRNFDSEDDAAGQFLDENG